ncbi:tetratricopeptide repeat protein [Sphingomonas sp.]|uniref:tetratricopeptide repeat protein n=1 Tax=Sphingomonas sp. TaxID=28214 RepID=UPI0025EF6C01|nr:tetratricopeptide repeat protein [Sphingomonas sp.]
MASAESKTSRIVLMGAGLIAVAGIGTAVWRAQHKTVPPAPVATATQPDAATMIAQLEAKLKANPKDAEGWRTLGWSFFNTQRFAESATAYKRATQLAPEKAEYWSSLGEALVLAGPGAVDPDAKVAFETAVKRDPSDPRARYYLAVGKDMASDHNGAIADWLALLAASPSDAPWAADVRKAIVDVGAKNKIEVATRLSAVKMGLPVAGVPSIATAAIPGPTPDQMRAASGIPKGQQDAMVDGMLASLAGKLAANPKNVDGWIMLMRSHVTLGQTVKARAAFKSATAANPGDAPRLTAAARELGIPT